MKTLAILLAFNVLTFCPLAANAQSFGNININLNNVMVGQRMQDMSARLDGANAVFAKKQKRERRNKSHKVALLHDASVTENTEFKPAESVALPN